MQPANRSCGGNVGAGEARRDVGADGKWRPAAPMLERRVVGFRWGEGIGLVLKPAYRNDAQLVLLSTQDVLLPYMRITIRCIGQEFRPAAKWDCQKNGQPFAVARSLSFSSFPACTGTAPIHLGAKTGPITGMDSALCIQARNKPRAWLR